MEKLLGGLNGIRRMSHDLTQRLYHIVEDRFYKRGGCLLKAGDVDRYIWYIETGLVVIYRQEASGRTVSHILGAGDFVIAVDSFSSGLPTGDTILTLEDTLTWCTTRVKLMDTCHQHPEFFEHYIQIDDRYRRAESIFAAKSPRERFEYLWKTRPDLFYRVKKDLLADYIRVSVSTFDLWRKGKTP